MQGSEKNGSVLNAHQPPEKQTKGANIARVFFALWPDALVQQALYALAMEYQPLCAARAMGEETLHMTLLFLGGIERVRLPQLMEAAGKISAPPFGFALEQLLFWPHNRIAYAASATEVPALHQLVTALQQAVVAAGFPVGNLAFKPHITLLRHVEQALESQTITTPVMWQVDSFVLVESVMTAQGTGYQILQKWPLSANATNAG